VHLDEGQIKAYLDHELAAGQAELVREHLAACPACQGRADALSSRTARVDVHLASISARPSTTPRLTTAHARLQARIAEKEIQTMSQRIFAPRYRTAWVVLGIVLVLAVALAFPPVRAIANSFLGLFRVEQFTVVQVNPGNLPEQLGSSSQLEALFTDSVHVEDKGEPQDVAGPEEASQLAGIPVRMPVSMEEQASIKVIPGAEITFNIDLQRVQLLLDEIGRSDIQLPADLNGASVHVSTASSVVAMYGDCQIDVEMARQEGFDPDDPSLPRLPRCTTFVQMPSPTVSAPPGLDVQKIGEAFLQVMGMSAEDAAHFAQSVDWTTTLVIPIPRYGTTYREVPVDGATGTLILQDLKDHPKQYLLVWAKDGILYSLTGPGDGSAGLRIANTLK